MDSKPTNPKDAIGTTKLPMHLVPTSVPALASLAFLEGALKYGKYNWRVAGVRMSIYLDAMRRHYEKLLNGEWVDPQTNVPHLANIIACCGIIEDARVCGKLIDDRPPVAPYGDYINGMEVNVAHLKELFKSHNPRQYTIHDSQQETPSPGTQAAGPQPGAADHTERPQAGSGRQHLRGSEARGRRSARTA